MSSGFGLLFLVCNARYPENPWYALNKVITSKNVFRPNTNTPSNAVPITTASNARNHFPLLIWRRFPFAALNAIVPSKSASIPAVICTAILAEWKNLTTSIFLSYWFCGFLCSTGLYLQLYTFGCLQIEVKTIACRAKFIAIQVQPVKHIRLQMLLLFVRLY